MQCKEQVGSPSNTAYQMRRREMVNLSKVLPGECDRHLMDPGHPSPIEGKVNAMGRVKIEWTGGPNEFEDHYLENDRVYVVEK
jgi:hypothetical protein